MTMINRRRFLQTATSLAAASPLAPMTALSANSSGYKALVCVFFFGGMDSHDMLIGYDQPSYDAWATARQSIIDNFATTSTPAARDRSSLLPLTPTNAGDFGSRSFALPPEMDALHSLFQTGRASFVSNVGPLIEPVTRQQFFDKTVRVPAKLQSHNDQQSTWQAFTGEGARAGWGGKVLDAFAQQSAFAAVSASRTNVFLTGEATRQFQIGNSIKTAFATGTKLQGSEARAQAVQEYYRVAAQGMRNPMMRDIISMQSAAIDQTNEISGVFDLQTLGDTVELNNNSLSSQLASVANMIAARNVLGINRQVFFVSMGGFDSHQNHASNMPGRFRQVSEAISSFTLAMEAAGLDNDVTLFTASDFGRTLISNPTGTDHGWGGHHIVAGGAVRGNRIVGEVPVFDPDHDQDLKRGAMIPTLSVDQYGAELARWFGLASSEIDLVFANRSNFDANAVQLFV